MSGSVGFLFSGEGNIFIWGRAGSGRGGGREVIS